MDEAIRKGEVIGGKYRIEGVLGVGAMGIVYAAHHLQLDERVALKALRSELVAYPDAVKRFSREAQAAAKIKNEHVTRVFDVGELADGTPYIVMESLEGEDLAHWLASRGALRLEEAIAFVLQACEALAEAHALGIVHRDLKPSNLFCSRRPDGALSIKILDFGISKIAALATSAADSGRASGAKSVVGSPFYMSPEQMQSSHDVDHRTDIWALGVILFELLTTAVPFEGESLPEVCVKVATRPPRSLRRLRSDLPEEVEATIAKCLEKDPDKRFENLAEFAGSLFPFAGKGARLSIERIVQVSRRARTTAAKAAADGASTLRHSDRPTIRPFGATVPPSRVDTSGHLYVGLAGAAVVALGVVLFWTRPIGNGEHSRPLERAAAKAAAQPGAPKIETIPQKPESLPKAEEERAVDGPFPNVEATFPRAPVRPAAIEGAPLASAPLPHEPTVGRHQRPNPADQQTAHDRARPPPKPLADPSPSEPGVELRRLQNKGKPREIDEADPYAR
jgi:serine/threonine protein kinase